MDLATKKCVPCEAGTPPLSPEQIKEYLPQAQGWEVLGNKKIRKKFHYKNFVEAMAFVNKLAEVAEEEGHHPDIHIIYNRVTIELTTHAIGGLSENDFIMGAKINQF